MGHFRVKESTAGTVGLDPFSVDDELGDGTFSGMRKDFVGGAGGVFDIDFCIGDVVVFEEAFGLTAIAAPGS